MFRLPDLPYAYDALSPVISARTMQLHHDKHHATYVKTVNSLLDEGDEHPASLEEVVRAAHVDADTAKLYNNAGQAWNHALFWVAMSPEPTRCDGDLASAINEKFGGLAQLGEAFVKQGAEHFGSGWAWLLVRGGELVVTTTHDADGPLTLSNTTPLLVCDLWEHAYYLDHQNDRKAFLTAWFRSLPDWDFAARQWSAAHGEGEAWAYPAPDKQQGTRAA
ncbi:Fe-Mn family superoxide dismutase [Caulobacter ginsengisoli]|uniref:Superoxide dismutase n=1 Tax=Caulobacter ginsengisoli TaxID=400775 RepID=A0ABU0IS96_9CAUL|nr:superoxide dismutase [Caulobacter ginsengisoli]MDQ0464887.1 Fe-Mn family superoxide dismutase [Caulobacter ginsengisoli]